MEASYTHRLDPRTDANLTAAILAVGNLLGVAPIADSIIEHLKDRIGDGMSDTQRFDPSSVYSEGVLGQVAGYVKETFGLEQPSNVHGADSRLGKDDPEAGNFFALDSFGQTRLERLFGGLTNEQYAARSSSAFPYGATRYSEIDPRAWNPASGAAGLTALNFGSTEFAQRGLDLPTTQYLFGQGYTQAQILNAAEDARALGLNPRDRQTQGISPRWTGFDPTGRGQREDANAAYAEWVRENKGEINRLGAEVKATEPGTREHEAATRALERLVREGSQQTGQAAVDERIDTVPDATPEERAGAHAAQDSNRRRIE